MRVQFEALVKSLKEVNLYGGKIDLGNNFVADFTKLLTR
jgi:hypothetical protein